MGKLADRIKPKPRLCRFGELINEHADDADKARIADRTVTHLELADAVSEEWALVSKTVVTDHRNGRCICYRAR